MDSLKLPRQCMVMLAGNGEGGNRHTNTKSDDTYLRLSRKLTWRKVQKKKMMPQKNGGKWKGGQDLCFYSHRHIERMFESSEEGRRKIHCRDFHHVPACSTEGKGNDE